MDEAYMPSERQQRFLSIGFIPTAVLSIFGSSLIITSIRNENKITPYRSIMLWLSVFDIIRSLSWTLQPFLSPSDGPDAWVWAFGNDATCNLMGGLGQFGFAAQWYSGLLSFYFVLTARYGVQQQTFGKVLGFVHGFIIVWSLATAIAGVALDVYGPLRTGPGCWVDGADCTENCIHDVVAWVFGGAPSALMFLSIFFNNLLLYCHVRGTITKGQKRAMLAEENLSFYGNSKSPEPSSLFFQSSESWGSQSSLFSTGKPSSELTSSKQATSKSPDQRPMHAQGSKTKPWSSESSLLSSGKSSFVSEETLPKCDDSKPDRRSTFSLTAKSWSSESSLFSSNKSPRLSEETLTKLGNSKPLDRRSMFAQKARSWGSESALISSGKPPQGRSLQLTRRSSERSLSMADLLHSANITKPKSVLRSSDKQWNLVKDVGKQSFSYVAVYFLCFGWSFALNILARQQYEYENDAESVFLPLLILQSIFLPAQGLFNAIIFFRPKYLNNRKEYSKETRRWCMRRALFGKRIKPNLPAKKIPQSSPPGGGSSRSLKAPPSTLRINYAGEMIMSSSVGRALCSEDNCSLIDEEDFEEDKIEKGKKSASCKSSTLKSGTETNTEG
eukprot:scaffold1429_cov110-Cylindrotheca_fusiformis.AAC.6